MIERMNSIKCYKTHMTYKKGKINLNGSIWVLSCITEIKIQKEIRDYLNCIIKKQLKNMI